jgi:hypothetical protein
MILGGMGGKRYLKGEGRAGFQPEFTPYLIRGWNGGFMN